jgi:hypothetical protein
MESADESWSGDAARAGRRPPVTGGLRAAWPWLGLLLFAQGLALAGGFLWSAQKWEVAGPVAHVSIGALPEPSGLVLLPDGEAFICVSDERWIARIDLDGKVLEQLEVNDSDLEAVCLDRAGEAVLVINERTLQIMRFAWNPLRFLDAVDLSARFRTHDPNRGPEGLDLLRLGGVVLAIESSPASLLLLHDDGHLMEFFLDCPSVSEVLHLRDSDHYLVISREQGLRVVNGAGRTRQGWMRLPGNSLEGLALVSGRGLYVPNDREPGEFLVFSRYPDERALLRDLWN